MKRTKLYVGLTLLIQSITMFVMFFVVLSRKKSLASALLAVAAVGGAAGAWLLYDQVKNDDRLLYRDGALCDFSNDDFMDLYGEDDLPPEETTIEIPVDDTATDDEFRF